MPTLNSPASLQQPIDRFARALTVPRRLLALHPRERGNPSNAAALAPAVTLSVISAFEGFVEELVATAAVIQGRGWAEIATTVGKLNNPDVKDLEDLLVNRLGISKGSLGKDFSVTQWKAPAWKPDGRGFWRVEEISWAEARLRSRAWMQARHLLTHGLTSGWQSEVWPHPITKENPPPPPASTVLRKVKGGHSLVIHGAISCARIYVECSRHAASVVADDLGVSVDTAVLPEFPLDKQTAPDVETVRARRSRPVADEPVEDDSTVVTLQGS